MAQEREHLRRRPGQESDPAPDPVAPAPVGGDQGRVQRIDDLLDEIDSVLEENAEEFVKNYVQKGGE